MKGGLELFEFLKFKYSPKFPNFVDEKEKLDSFGNSNSFPLGKNLLIDARQTNWSFKRSVHSFTCRDMSSLRNEMKFEQIEHLEIRPRQDAAQIFFVQFQLDIQLFKAHELVDQVQIERRRSVSKHFQLRSGYLFIKQCLIMIRCSNC